MKKFRIRAIARSHSWLSLATVLLTALAGIWFVVGLVTISVGTSSRAAPNGFDLEDLLFSADQALYRAKAHGRNGVVVA